MKFAYIQVIRELLFSAITCRPDILYSIIRLSQYNNKPSQIHYVAVKRFLWYLRDTIEDGLYYWCPSLNADLTDIPAPTLAQDNHDIKITDFDPTEPIECIDSDWVGDSLHRRSISGISLCFAGAPVVYRFRFQPTISQSSTKADFIAAVEAGKLILYIRSMLNDLDIHQDEATTLYEDNLAAIEMANASRPKRRTGHM